MAQPTGYTPTTDFSQEEQNQVAGRSTVRTAQLDAEFANIETTLDQTLANLAVLQRDDTKLGNSTVHPDALTTATLALLGSGGWTPRGAWVTATAYAVKDMVEQGGDAYVCATAHTSGTFATDYAAAKWIRISQLSYSVLASTASGNGASLIGVQDAAAYFAAVNVEAVLAEMHANIITRAGLALNNTFSGSNVISNAAVGDVIRFNVAAVNGYVYVGGGGVGFFSGPLATNQGFYANNIDNRLSFYAGGLQKMHLTQYGAVFIDPPVTGGTATAYTATLGETVLTTNRIYECRIHITNTGSASINFDGLGTDIIVLPNGNNVYAGALRIGMIAKFRHAGVNVVLLNPEKPYRGCLLSVNGSTLYTTGVDTSVVFSGEVYDTDGIFTIGTSAINLVVPAGATKIRLGCQFNWTSTAGTKIVYVDKDGSSLFLGGFYRTLTAGEQGIGAVSQIIPVVAGNIFTFRVTQNSGANAQLVNLTSSASMEIIE